MSGFPLAAVQAALYQTLVNDTALAALVVGVFDHVPHSSAFPYVVFDESAVESWGLLLPAAYRCRFDLAIYSRKGGQKQAMQIASAIRTALHDEALILSGFSVMRVAVMEAVSDRLNDGVTHRADVRVDVWVSEEAA